MDIVVYALVLLSYAAIAALAWTLASWVLKERAPNIVRASEGICAAAVIVALLLVNWVRYWRSTPLRVGAAIAVIALSGQTLIACLAVTGGIALGWASWNTHGNDVLAGLGLVASGVAIFFGGFHLVISIGFSVYILIFGWGASTNRNLDRVRNQNADIDADFADTDEIERALGGTASDGKSRPYKYND